MKTQSVLIAVGVIIVLLVFVFLGTQSAATPAVTIADPSILQGLQSSTTPWIAEIDHLAERLTAIGLPQLKEEGTVLHIHQHLDVFVDGSPVAVSPGIGISEAGHFISPLHTHDTSQVIHVESPTAQTFTLGQFFDIWGVPFTAQTIGGYHTTNEKLLKVYVNGKEFTGDPRTLPLEAHQEIVAAYGTAKELPNPIPASYTFPAGE